MAHIPKPQRRFVTQQTAAESLDVSVKTVRRWIAEGTLTGYRVGGRIIRVDAEEVAALARPIPSAKMSGPGQAHTVGSG